MSRGNVLSRYGLGLALYLTIAVAGALELTANRSEIAVGENVAVKLKNAPAFSEVDWTHSPGLTKLEAERGKARFRGAAPGVATVTILIDGKPEGSVSVNVIDLSGGMSTMPQAPVAAPGASSFPAQPVATPPAYVPPVYGTPASAPPVAYTPPVPAAPVYTPPAYTPPIYTPPAYTPPAVVQPVYTPPAYTPPVQAGGRDYTSRAGGWGGAPVPAPAQVTPSSSIVLGQTSLLSMIQTYHWNNGIGAPPGSIALVDAQGRRHGPWPVTGSAGPGGVANAYWSARPMVSLPAGTYTVIDSDPSTWTPDPQNGGRGFTRHEAQAATPAFGQAAGQAYGQAPAGYPGTQGGWGQATPGMGGTATGAAYPGYTGGGAWAQPGQVGTATGLPGAYGQIPGLTQGGMPGAYPGNWPTQGGGPNQVAGQARALLDIGNGQPVAGKPERPSKLDLGGPHVVTLIRTFHWNNGQGAFPGSIGLRCRDGSNHGPWQAIGEPSPDGIQNAYWAVRPNVQLPACVCTVVVSDTLSWSHNDGSKNRGFVRVEGYPLGAAAGQAGMAGGDTTGTTLETLERAHDAVRKMDETKKALESLKNIFK